MKCWVCGEKYDKDSITPVWIWDPYKKKWVTIKEVSLNSKRIPLCEKCFRSYILSEFGRSSWIIDFDH